MKKRLFATLSLALVFVLVLAACSSPAATVEPAVEEPAVVAEETLESEPQPADDEKSDSDMQSFLLEKLQGSDHTLDFILSREKTREEWEKTIDRMIGYGAKINEEEKQILIDWLVSR